MSPKQKRTAPSVSDTTFPRGPEDAAEFVEGKARQATELSVALPRITSSVSVSFLLLRLSFLFNFSHPSTPTHTTTIRILHNRCVKLCHFLT